GSRSSGKVHSFGKREQAIKRNPNVPVVVRGWLYKQDSSGMRLWKRKWFVLADFCLFYYKGFLSQFKGFSSQHETLHLSLIPPFSPSFYTLAVSLLARVSVVLLVIRLMAASGRDDKLAPFLF
ncbi:hypothetical protein LDENG_00274230, partial [Lucifuga dentata]